MKMIFIISPPYSTGRTHSMSRERAVSVASGCVLRRFPAAVARGSPSLSRLRRLPIDSQASRAPACGQSVTIYEFTACDRVADCAAALGGTRSPPPQAGPTLHDTNPGGAGGGTADRLGARRGRRLPAPPTAGAGPRGGGGAPPLS